MIAALRESYRPPASQARALAPDLRGHGRASDRVPVTLDAVLEDLAALSDEPFTLVGYSMGGRIALHAALAPDLGARVRRLVLIGASPGLADADERANRRAADEALADEAEDLAIEVFAARWAQTPVLAGLPADVRARVHADRLRSTPSGLARALRGLGTGALPSLWDRLGELTMPVELMVGARDAKFRAIAEQMLAHAPSCELLVVEGAGHAVHLERPAVVASRLGAAAAD